MGKTKPFKFVPDYSSNRQVVKVRSIIYVYTSTSTTPTFITEAFCAVTYVATAVLNDCYNEATVYTALAYSYWASFHDAYGCLCHTHYRYQLQLSYKSMELINQSYEVYITPHHTTSY